MASALNADDAHGVPTLTERGRQKADRRAAILESAATMFAERGYAGVTIEDLGAAAGVSGRPSTGTSPESRRFSPPSSPTRALTLLSGAERVIGTAPDATSALRSLIALPRRLRPRRSRRDPRAGSRARTARRAAPNTTCGSLQRQYVEHWVDTLSRLRPDRAEAGAQGPGTRRLRTAELHSAQRPHPRAQTRRRHRPRHPGGDGMGKPHVVTLRATRAGDLDALFQIEQDDVAVHMAAFTPPDPTDRAMFDAHWHRLLSDAGVDARTIRADGDIVGSVARWIDEGTAEITYWVDRAHWGEGIATRAMRLFLEAHAERPVRARVASDNAASIAVLEKLGFDAGRHRGELRQRARRRHRGVHLHARVTVGPAQLAAQLPGRAPVLGRELADAPHEREVARGHPADVVRPRPRTRCAPSRGAPRGGGSARRPRPRPRRAAARQPAKSSVAYVPTSWSSTWMKAVPARSSAVSAGRRMLRRSMQTSSR